MTAPIPTQRALAAHLGISTSAVCQAHAKGEFDHSDFFSVCEWALDKREKRLGYAAPRCAPRADLLASAVRRLLAAGLRAQRLSVGAFWWAREDDGSWRCCGELAGPLALAAKGLPRPPFANQLARLDLLGRQGRGLETEARLLHAKLSEQLGPDDPALARLAVRSAAVNARIR